MQSTLNPIEQHVIDFVLKLRKSRKLTQEDIGVVIGVGNTFVSSVENPKHPAKYNLSHINALADHFGISPKEFLPEKALK